MMSEYIEMTTEEFMGYPTKDELFSLSGKCRLDDKIVMGNAVLIVYKKENKKFKPQNTYMINEMPSVQMSLQRVKITDWWIHGTN